MGIDEMNELNEILNSIDISKLPVREQLILIEANVEMLEKVKHILIKHKIESFDGGTFLFKM